MHGGEQFFAGRIDERNRIDVDENRNVASIDAGQLPAICQFFHPWTCQLSFKLERQHLGFMVRGNS
jgi:hypothetical protein